MYITLSTLLSIKISIKKLQNNLKQSSFKSQLARTKKMWFIFGILAITLYLIYKFLTWDFNYWKNRGVIGPKPTVLLGNFRNDLLRQKHVAYDSREIYRLVASCSLIKNFNPK